MKTLSSTSVCRRCRSYEPEGRRGGHCQQLNVAVQGAWMACALAIPPFSPAWESFEDIMAWQQKTLAAMQPSAESTIIDLLPDSHANENTDIPCASESTELSFSSVTHSQMTQLPAAPASIPSQSRLNTGT